MDFGSEYILDEEEDEILEEEEMPAPVVHHRSPRPRPPRYAMGDYGGFECEIMDFDEEEEEEVPQPDPQAAGKKAKKVDTNTVNLTMGSLNEKSDTILPASQKLNCQNDECGAVFSHLAEVMEKNGKKIWKCPFCDTENEAAEELPNLTDQLTDVMYVKDTNKLPNLVPPQDKNFPVIFVVDTSASMCQTIEVPRAGASKCLQDLYDEELGRHQQYLDQMGPDDKAQILQQLQNSKTTMEASRLMLIKDAVITILKDLKSKKPDVRVGLVIFNEKVMVLGDGRSKAEVEGGQLMDKFEMQVIGQQHRDLRPISESAEDLIKEIMGLQEEGRTALGPALLIAEKMVCLKGSKVILLTDGFANIGLGKLEETTQPEIDTFYDSLIDTCKLDGVSVSVITCDEAGIKNKLGDVPDETGGIVQKIQACEYMEPLKEELGRQVAATDGLLHFVVGKNMYVRVGDPKIQKSLHTKTIGNIHLGKKIPLKFGMRQSPDPQQQQTPPADPSTNSSTAADGTAPPSSAGGTPPSTATTTASDQTANQDQSDTTTPKKADDDKEAAMDQSDEGEANTAAQPQSQAEADGGQCPFQVQIKYTDMYGTETWRVWTKQKQVTKSRQQAEDRMNIKSAVTSFMQTASDDILRAKDTYKLSEVIQSLTAQCQDWQNKIKPADNRIFVKKLLEFQELLMQVARNPMNDDLASQLRSYKEDRLVRG